MPKFLIEASYSTEGVRGVAGQGGSARRVAVAKMISDVGGELELFYFAFGDVDVYAVADLPDLETAAAIALRINADGRTHVKTVVLMTPEQVDSAAQKRLEYVAPGETPART